MINFKKIGGFFLSICLLFVLLSGEAFAASAKVSVSSASGNVGNTVTVTCSATTSGTAIGGADITEDVAGNGELVVDNNTVTGVLQNNIPPVFEVTVRGAADYPITIRKGFLIGNDPEYMQQHVFLLPDRVEFKSDGASPIYYSNNFEV